ncbi:MAG: hypothetical protein SGCHY_001021 [Lobulomycetales sp.]
MEVSKENSEPFETRLPAAMIKTKSKSGSGRHIVAHDKTHTKPKDRGNSSGPPLNATSSSLSSKSLSRKPYEIKISREVSKPKRNIGAVAEINNDRKKLDKTTIRSALKETESEKILDIGLEFDKSPAKSLSPTRIRQNASSAHRSTTTFHGAENASLEHAKKPRQSESPYAPLPKTSAAAFKNGLENRQQLQENVRNMDDEKEITENVLLGSSETLPSHGDKKFLLPDGDLKVDNSHRPVASDLPEVQEGHAFHSVVSIAALDSAGSRNEMHGLERTDDDTLNVVASEHSIVNRGYEENVHRPVVSSNCNNNSGVDVNSPSEAETTGFDANSPPKADATGVDINASSKAEATGVDVYSSPKAEATGVDANSSPKSDTTGIDVNVSPKEAEAAGVDVKSPPKADATGVDVNASPKAEATGVDVNSPPKAEATGVDEICSPKSDATGIDVNSPPKADATGVIVNSPPKADAAGVDVNASPKADLKVLEMKKVLSKILAIDDLGKLEKLQEFINGL